ncbi:MAG: hypothetical protein M3067_04610 [Chloroflexota bacterium]|nr:hypothetical protein [Chloroflexota bacterium]
MTLAEAVEDAAGRLPGVERREVPGIGGIEWLVGGRPFAAASAGSVEFRLDPVVARAALGTPDTSVSGRGAEWVAFSPAELDRFAVDRALAWLGAAHRRAAG